jgi:type IV secretory pathway TrbD component
MPLERQRTREQRVTILNGVLCFELILVVLQLWLLTATMNAWLGGDESVVWPALGASLACLLLNLGLVRYLLRGRV